MACSSISTAAEILNPARAAPKLKPPAPANRSITLANAFHPLVDIKTQYIILLFMTKKINRIFKANDAFYSGIKYLYFVLI